MFGGARLGDVQPPCHGERRTCRAARRWQWRGRLLSERGTCGGGRCNINTGRTHEAANGLCTGSHLSNRTQYSDCRPPDKDNATHPADPLCATNVARAGKHAWSLLRLAHPHSASLGFSHHSYAPEGLALPGARPCLKRTACISLQVRRRASGRYTFHAFATRPHCHYCGMCSWQVASCPLLRAARTASHGTTRSTPHQAVTPAGGPAVAPGSWARLVPLLRPKGAAGALEGGLSARLP
jgi:hypothetical protein